VTDATWLVVGLGNIGEQYQKTRHNIGVLALEKLSTEVDSNFSRQKKTNSFIAEAKDGGNKIVLAYLDCYMNESGGPTKSLMQFFKVTPERLIVLHDELDLDFLNLRVKFSGGDNGHNGLKSIRGALGTGDFYRVRLGIGRPKTQQDTASYVLEKFSKAEAAEQEEFLSRAAIATRTLINHGLAAAQNKFNQKVVENE
jgi:PTH1 family peptidyl-tRNA hydrolase